MGAECVRTCYGRAGNRRRSRLAGTAPAHATKQTNKQSLSVRRHCCAHGRMMRGAVLAMNGARGTRASGDAVAEAVRQRAVPVRTAT